MKSEASSGESETILVCFALKEEAAPFQKLAAERKGISILITGIGRRNAEESVRNFVASKVPEFVVTCGFAGGLNPALESGAVVFSTNDPTLREWLLSANTRPANIFCATRIAITASEKEQLHISTGADVVEMESEAVHSVCCEHGIPCATLRAISDTAGEDLPLDFNHLSKPDMNLDYGKLAWAIAKSPGKIRELLRLQKRCRLAAENLAGVLAKITFR